MSATVTIVRGWSADDLLQVSVTVDASYPDALDQARVTVIAGYAEALGVTLAAEAREDGDT